MATPAADRFPYGWRFVDRVQPDGTVLVEQVPLTADEAQGRGQASLGCLRPLGTPQLYLRSRPNKPQQVSMRLSDSVFSVDVGVIDIRLYNDADYSPNRQRIAQIAARLTQTSDIILSVGLTRPFTFDPDLAPVHWLQVNNIHFADDPLWQHKG